MRKILINGYGDGNDDDNDNDVVIVKMIGMMIIS